MPKKTPKPFDPAKYIKNEKDADLALQVAIEEDPGDGSLIEETLSNIKRAFKGKPLPFTDSRGYLDDDQFDDWVECGQVKARIYDNLTVEVNPYALLLMVYREVEGEPDYNSNGWSRKKTEDEVRAVKWREPFLYAPPDEWLHCFVAGFPRNWFKPLDLSEEEIARAASEMLLYLKISLQYAALKPVITPNYEEMERLRK